MVQCLLRQWVTINAYHCRYKVDVEFYWLRGSCVFTYCVAVFCVWVCKMHCTVPFRLYHRHRIDKYLDTLLSNQTSWTVKPPITAERVSRKMADCPVLPNQSQRSKSSMITDERSRSLSARWLLWSLAGCCVGYFPAAILRITLQRWLQVSLPVLLLCSTALYRQWETELFGVLSWQSCNCLPQVESQWDCPDSELYITLEKMYISIVRFRFVVKVPSGDCSGNTSEENSGIFRIRRH